MCIVCIHKYIQIKYIVGIVGKRVLYNDRYGNHRSKK